MGTIGRLVLVTSVLVTLSACSGDDEGSTARTGDADLHEPSAAVATDEGAPGADPGEAGAVAVGQPGGQLMADAAAAVAAVRARCETTEPVVVTDRELALTAFDGPSLACADLAGIDLSEAVVGASRSPGTDGVRGGGEGDVGGTDAAGSGRLDLDGADLSGADLSGAHLSISAVGASFAGADLSGADLTDSDLRGADLRDTDLTGTRMTSLPGGLTSADLTGATLGCNVLVADPGIVLEGVAITTSCGDTPAAWGDVVLSGDLSSARLAGFDFDDVVVYATSFAGADLRDADLSDEGVWPDGSDFTGADLSGADLSRTGFFDATFAGADLTGARLDETYWRDVVADEAVLADVVAIEWWAERTSLRDAVFTGAVLDDTIFDRVDLAGADMTGSSRLGVVVRDVVCPTGLATRGNVGSCDQGGGWGDDGSVAGLSTGTARPARPGAGASEPPDRASGSGGAGLGRGGAGGDDPRASGGTGDDGAPLDLDLDDPTGGPGDGSTPDPDEPAGSDRNSLDPNGSSLDEVDPGLMAELEELQDLEDLTDLEGFDGFADPDGGSIDD